MRYGKHDYNPEVSNAPGEILTLWKCTVMPHFVQYLRYLPLASQIETLQKEFNSSLRRTLRVYGHGYSPLGGCRDPPPPLYPKHPIIPAVFPTKNLLCKSHSLLSFSRLADDIEHTKTYQVHGEQDHDGSREPGPSSPPPRR